jgi:hypothetical protein
MFVGRPRASARGVVVLANEGKSRGSPPMGKTNKSLSPAGAAFALIVAAAAVLAIYTSVVVVTDVQTCAELRAEAQSIATAAALGSVAQLPKGTAAVVQAASRIVGSQKGPGLRGHSAQQGLEIGHWEEDRQSFECGMAKPNAVRVTIRVTSEAKPFALFRSPSQDPIEVQAVAVVKPLGTALIAEAGDRSSAIR